MCVHIYHFQYIRGHTHILRSADKMYTDKFLYRKHYKGTQLSLTSTSIYMCIIAERLSARQIILHRISQRVCIYVHVCMCHA